MVDEYDTYSELEAQRNLENQESKEISKEDQPEPYKMGAGAYILILFALFVDIIEIFATYSGVGLPVAVVLGLIVDTAIFIGVGFSRDARKQWKRFLAGFIGENFPFLAQAIEWLPIRTLALIWMYRGMSKPPQIPQTTDEQ